MLEVKRIKLESAVPVLKEILDGKSRVRITAAGMSMFPFIRENIDTVELASARFAHIRRGDIVLIERKHGQCVLHRVVGKEAGAFYLAGDAQEWVEGPLQPEQLLAVVACVWRNGKPILCTNAFWKLLSMIWLILLPCRPILIKGFNGIRKFVKLNGGVEPN